MGTRFQKLYAENANKNTKFVVKPSTELIPDEYDVAFDGNESLHIFVADPDLVFECRNLFKELCIRIPDSNVHDLESCTEVNQTLEEVATTEEYSSMLFMVFWGYSKKDGEFTLEDDSSLPFYKIWSWFLTSKCPKFRDKPKVFLFNVIKSIKRNEPDGALYIEPKSPYEVPNEADVLIIYKHSSDKKESITFIEELGETMNEFGKTEDLGTIVSIINTAPYTRPVIISTMLKKLFMVPSDHRGHHLSSKTNHEFTLEELLRIDKILADIEAEKRQESPSFFRKMKKRLSFRSKSFTDGGPSKELIKRETSPPKTKLDYQIAEHSAPSVSTPTATRKSLKETRASVEKLAPRLSVDKANRRPSASKLAIRKISQEERKPWKP